MGPAIQIRYADANDKLTQRTIQPLEWLEPTKLVAYCYLRRELRHFLLFRMRDCQLGQVTPDEQLACERAVLAAGLQLPQPQQKLALIEDPF